MDTLTLQGLRFADLLGKSLTKSLYRQLPRYHAETVALTDTGDGFHWTMTPHGRVNWCPPDCTVETLCRCDYTHCRRRPECRTKRAHQHLLVGAEGSLYQGVLYRVYSRAWADSFPYLSDLWDRYEHIDHEQMDVQAAARSSPKLSFMDSIRTPPGEQEAARLVTERRNTRLQLLTKALGEIDRQALHAFQTWVTAAMEKLPIILLR